MQRVRALHRVQDVRRTVHLGQEEFVAKLAHEAHPQEHDAQDEPEPPGLGAGHGRVSSAATGAAVSSETAVAPTSPDWA